MKTLMIMNRDFTLLGELPQFESISLTRSYWSIGDWQLTVSHGASCADMLAQGVLLFPPNETHKMMVVEDIYDDDKMIRVNGCMLKGEVRKRICVPPLSLPTQLKQWNGSAWAVIDNPDTILALMQGDVYEGYAPPDAPTTGMVFLDMSALSTVYNWDSKTQTGETWADLGVAKLRSKYKNFGWDRYIGSAESAMKYFMRNNITEPEDAKRIITDIVLAPDRRLGASLPWQARFDRLETLLTTIGETTGMGWDILPDFKQKRFVFDVVQGRNLSTGTLLATISRDMGNAEAVELQRALTNSATTAYTGGVGQDEERLILAVNNEPEGAQRRETWVDAGSVDDPEMITLAGQNKIKDMGEKVTLTAKVLDTGASQYERDWDVGDIVLVRHKGAMTATRVLSVTETYERDKPRLLDVTFGTSPVSLTGSIRRLQQQAVR